MLVYALTQPVGLFVLMHTTVMHVLPYLYCDACWINRLQCNLISVLWVSALTSGGWQDVWWHCILDTSSSFGHSGSPPPSNLTTTNRLHTLIQKYKISERAYCNTQGKQIHKFGSTNSLTYILQVWNEQIYFETGGGSLWQALQTVQWPTFDLLSEADPLWVSEGLGLFVDVANVQHLTHELNYRLGFVEGRGRH